MNYIVPFTFIPLCYFYYINLLYALQNPQCIVIMIVWKTKLEKHWEEKCKVSSILCLPYNDHFLCFLFLPEIQFLQPKQFSLISYIMCICVWCCHSIFYNMEKKTSVKLQLYIQWKHFSNMNPMQRYTKIIGFNWED